MKSVELEVIKVWGTIDKEGVYPYGNIYDSEEEANKEIGTIQNGLEIVGVKQGWFIKGTEEHTDEISQDFYFSIDDVEDDLFERIIPAHARVGLRVKIKKVEESTAVVKEPFGLREILKYKDENNCVSGIVEVELREILDVNYEGFLDILSEKLVMNGSLYGISYGIVGHHEDTLLFEVSGNIEPLLEDYQDEIEEMLAEA